MRDDSYLDSAVAARTQAPAWRAGAVTAVGAMVSLAILAGVVIWSYRLGVRDATEIPVIRAEAGLTKARPEEAGGQVAPHQERAVFDAVTAATPETAPTVALAPAPEALAEEDVAPVARAPEPEARPAGPEAAPDATALQEEAPAAEPLPEAAVDPLAAAVEAAIAEALATAPDAATDAATGAAPETAAETEPDGDAGEGAPRFAPAAAPRPAPQEEVAPAAITAAAVSASPVQIQLGAYASEAVAEQQWAAITGKNGDLLSGLGRAVTPVSSGGSTLYRLRAGPFGSVDEAAALCRALSVRRQDCIVARAR